MKEEYTQVWMMVSPIAADSGRARPRYGKAWKEEKKMEKIRKR